VKVSIITVCFNSVLTLRDTIDSVLSQNYKDIEYIIIDGGSTDGTTAIIQEYGFGITKWVSEPDRGIYDAMNKGIGMASGDVIGSSSCSNARVMSTRTKFRCLNLTKDALNGLPRRTLSDCRFR
jgi:hypothetical protein